MAGVLGQVQHGRFPLDRLVVRDGKPMKGKCGKRPETQESYCPKRIQKVFLKAGSALFVSPCLTYGECKS